MDREQLRESFRQYTAAYDAGDPKIRLKIDHSAYRLPEGLSGEEQACCDILRDADKIDIFRVNCDTPLEDIYNVTTEALRASPVSDAVRSCFLNRTAVQRSVRRTPADYVVAHLCLVFELV